MNKDDIALVILHALLLKPGTSQQPMSDIFDIAEAFVQKMEERNDIKARSRSN